MQTDPKRRVQWILGALLLSSLQITAADILYVADDGNNAVYRYQPPSTTPFTFATGFNGELFGLATGSDGQLYTVNNIGNLIQRFDSGGSLAGGFGTGGQVDITALTSAQAFGPVGVAYSPAGGGSLVVSAYNSGHLIRLNAATGAWDTSFGIGGLLDAGDQDNGERPIGVAYNATGNFIYYTREDGSIRRVAADGTGDVAINLNLPVSILPYGIGMNSDSSLYVADLYTSEVLKFNLTGTDAMLDAGYGTGGRVSVTSGVFGLAVSMTGAVYVTGGQTVSLISPDGSSVSPYLTGFGNSTGIAIFANPIPEARTTAMVGVVFIGGCLWVRRRALKADAEVRGGVA
jgi:sugar lactone lactonase YvrE